MEGRTADFGDRREAALVLGVDPVRRPSIDARRVAVTLGLTPSDGQMAALLVDNLTVREIATATQRSQDCERWLTKRVYRKLGIKGKVEMAC